MAYPTTPLPTLHTERLTLVALTPAAYTAWAAGDATALSAATGVPFADAAAPPLLGEDLPKIRDLVLARWNPEAIGWWGWLVTLTSTGEPVGSVGFAGRPDDGVATIGYSVYERHQGRGYGTEATAAAVSWALSHEGVDGVRATIPDWNASSVRLAEKIGFVMTGTAEDPRGRRGPGLRDRPALAPLLLYWFRAGAFAGGTFIRSLSCAPSFSFSHCSFPSPQPLGPRTHGRSSRPCSSSRMPRPRRSRPKS